MSPVVRRIAYVTSYEIVAILLTTVGVSLLGFGAGQSGVLAITASTIAVVWNFVWTTVFEAWESRQVSPTRTLARRIAHTIGFEFGLLFLLLPVVAWLLKVSLLEALTLEVGLLAFFLVYTFVFARLFDAVFPRSCLSQREAARIWAASTARRDGQPEPAPVESALPIIERGLRAPGSTLHLASRGPEPAGFAVVVPRDDGLEILYLGVAPSAWGTGVAGCLLRDVTDHAVATGRTDVDLWVYDDNTRAVDAYRRRGWVATDEVRIHATSGRGERRFVKHMAERVGELEQG